MKQVTGYNSNKQKGKKHQIESFSQIIHPFQVKISCYEKSKKYCKQGRWTMKEKIKFCVFLSYHKIMFSRDFNRRFFKIFKLMSNFIKTRNPNQCRSHHQKIYRQYPSFSSYINKIKKNVSTKVFQSYLNLYDEQLRQIGVVMGMQQQFQGVQQEQIINQYKKSQIKSQEKCKNFFNKKFQAQNIIIGGKQDQIKKEDLNDKKEEDQEKTRLPKTNQIIQNTHNFQTSDKQQSFDKRIQSNYFQYQQKKTALITNCNKLWYQYMTNVLQLEQLQKMKYYQ